MNDQSTEQADEAKGTWLDRVRAEHAELVSRRDALESFLRHNADEPYIQREQVRLMWLQLDHMAHYASVLGKRIAAAEGRPGKFRKKPVVVEAVQYPCEHPALKRCGCRDDPGAVCADCGYAFIQTPGGCMRVAPGDWVITGVNGEHYLCKPDIFEKTYESAE